MSNNEVIFEKLVSDPRLEAEHHAFTFEHGQEHFNHYVVIAGPADVAREVMVQRFGMKWSLQYDYDLIFIQAVVRWNWKELA